MAFLVFRAGFRAFLVPAATPGTCSDPAPAKCIHLAEANQRKGRRVQCSPHRPAQTFSIPLHGGLRCSKLNTREIFPDGASGAGTRGASNPSSEELHFRYGQRSEIDFPVAAGDAAPEAAQKRHRGWLPESQLLRSHAGTPE
ncbi:hypothetical protein OPT61_g9538 [Boeremia exigua]|uniref:Uncharacterized protein n=1 Tax=Boeremia exigua TaxID=749465 RepID=A0ACC2HU13_9PLEO|nr:hypothetical protein OPT61_g9538 [Boeremia exigua]